MKLSKYVTNFMASAVLILALFLLLISQPASISANATDPFLWPYNQPTTISFNENDVYQAWVNWRNAQITSNNAGGNGRLRVMGGVSDSTTVSEGMGYGILFASIFDEQSTLDGLFLFARDHFNEQGVMDWHIGNPGERIGEGGATDAEVDMALGLVNACVKVQQDSWPASSAGIDYCAEATALINAIYTYEVDHPGSAPPAGIPNNQGNELIPGDTWNLEEDYPEGIINMSYFPPGYFEVFGKFTTNEAAWNAVINRNYAIVNLIQDKPANCSSLVPNWNQYDGDAQLVSWQTNNYSWWSYDAARFAWRIAVDQAWYGRPQAAETMNEIGGFFSSAGFNNIGEHTMNGQRVGSGPWPFFVANAGAAVWAAPNPTAVNCGTATGSLQETRQSAYNRVLNTSDNPNSYYGNAWRLLSMLLMTGNFPNFYEMAQGNLPTATPGSPTNTPAPPPPTATANPGGYCSVDYDIVNQWGNGFQANITINNQSSVPIAGWNLTWSFGSGQSFNSGWNATFNPSGSNMSASNVAGHWNGTIGANGGTVAFGIIGNHSGNITIPADFAVNGISCMDGGLPTNTPVPPTSTAAPPTNTAVPPTNTSAPPTNTSAPPTNTSVPPTNTPVPPTATPGGGGSCSVNYNIVNQWNNGFQADVTITNHSGTTINGWQLQWSFTGGQAFGSGWNATFSTSGSSVTASNPAGHWNGTLNANGGTAAFGFQGTHTGNVVVPSAFTLNGQSCGGPPPPPTPTVPGPTATPTVPGPTPTPTVPGPTPTAPPPGTHVQNPFAGADFYINPDYAAAVLEQAADTGGQLGAQMALVANISTAVWMDRIGAITAGRGLEGHLDEALAQQNGSTPMTIMIVIYDLPNRDCAALASNGELLIAEDGLNRYKTEYIDPIVDILNNPEYSSLRIVTIIEPDSLPNLVTNLSTPACAEANSSGAYVQGIQYAVNQLHTMSNVYIYLDIGHSGWLGWDSNFGPTVNLYTQTIQGTTAGFNSIDGFITNTANYTSLEEPFLPDNNLNVGGQPVRSSNFYEWNPYFDELDFSAALRSAFINNGFPSGIGMLIDTSRNGWGGDDRPTAVSTSTNLNTYVDESRIDQRPHRGGWCNQAGAGIGERPTASPAAGIDAYVWVKPPGESDGISDPDFEVDPNDPNKKHDGMCDPNMNSTYNSNYPTNALPNAPHAGRWFPEQFQMLVENAYPPLN